MSVVPHAPTAVPIVEDDQSWALRPDQLRRIVLTVVGVSCAVGFLAVEVPSRGRLFAWGAILLILQPIILKVDQIDDDSGRRRIGVFVEATVGMAWGLLPVVALAIDPQWQTLQAAALVPVLMTGVSTLKNPVKTPRTFGLPLCIVGGIGLLMNASGAGRVGVLILVLAWIITVVFHREVGVTLRELSETLDANIRLTEGLTAEHERLERAYNGLEGVNGKLDLLARTDPLTGLANRLMFTERLHSSLDLLAEGTAQSVGLAYLDLDGFKQVNDGLGHKVGDQLLIAVADRLTGAADNHGELLARLGGDELVVLGIDVRAEDLGQRVLDAFTAPFRIDGRNVEVGASVGVVVVDSETNPDAMLRYADAALYRAKDRGGRVYEVFGPELRQQLSNRRTEEVELRRAFAQGLIQPYLQPIVDLKSGAIIGAEALARWEHPKGVRTAASFIETLSDLGLVDRMSEVFLTQIEQLQESLRSDGIIPMKVALNVPPAHLERLLRRHEGETRLDAVVIEITEEGAFGNIERVRELLVRSRAAGMQVLLDDFGVGFSSLSLATQLPVDGLKIDRSFVASLTTSEAARAVVAAVVQLAAGMNLQVIAEGIESEAQLQLLRDLGVDHGQGFLFSPAVPLTEFETWIRDHMHFGVAVTPAQ